MIARLFVLAWDAVIWALIVALAEERTSLSALNVIFGALAPLLAVRRAFTTSRCGLSRSVVNLCAFLGTPYLNARDAARRAIAIASSKLLALAEAMIAGGRDDQDAWRVSATRRQRAAPPGFR